MKRLLDKSTAETPFIVISVLKIIIKLYCQIQHALYDEMECSLALTHIVPIYIYNKMKYGK